MSNRRISVQYHFFLDLSRDREIIEALDRASNKTEYIRRCIKADLEAQDEIKRDPADEPGRN